jgi:Dolichyl-phosphate-mannose-protein mannosyltransferase
VTEVALRTRTRSFSRATAWDLTPRAFAIATGLTSAAVATVLAVFIERWPPHEDETLALFVGRGSLPHVLHTVIAQRGGAPLHFLLAWAVVHLGGGLIALRAVSVLFAVASVPAIAVLGARLADRTVGVVAAVLASGTWVFLFHGIYGRMYSLFLFTSALSFVALLNALERGGRKRFLLWGLALFATLASHPYAGIVLVAQALYVVLRGDRRRAALTTVAVVVVAATPFWFADLVLRRRLQIGVGGGGSRLGSPGSVSHYLWWVAGDFSAGPHAWLPAVLALAAVGFVLLAGRRRAVGLLTACVIAVPTIALTVARLNWTASPQSRHLIFALPFFSTLLGAALVGFGRLRPPLTALVAAAAIGVLVFGEARWADGKTPPLFHGDSSAQQQARAQAAEWLASSGRPDDVLLGYEPLYLVAWERNSSLSHHTLPRADPKLLASALRSLREPVGRGVWVFDSSDTTNPVRRSRIRLVVPHPARAFEARAFGPYLVIRSRTPLRTRLNYLLVSERVMRLGRSLGIGDADINLHALLIAGKQFRPKA